MYYCFYCNIEPTATVRNFRTVQILDILALKYPPCTKALVGAILKNPMRWEEAYKLKSTLNPITPYKINISKDILPNEEEWRIILE